MRITIKIPDLFIRFRKTKDSNTKLGKLDKPGNDKERRNNLLIYISEDELDWWILIGLKNVILLETES